jgi:hypothetical protein
MALILNTMFLPGAGPSFQTGFVLPDSAGTGRTVTRGIFGFSTDLAAHKELFQVKGTSGVKCCLNCGNVVKKRMVESADATVVGLGCADRSKFQRYDDDDFYFIVDELERVSGTIAPSRFAKLETALGVHHVPDGLLANRSIRSIVKPSQHCIRDWMHTYVGDGVVNSEMGMLINEMARFGFTREHVQSFSQLCTLPKAHGKPHASWFGESRLHPLYISSFASTLLSMLPIVALFLIEFSVATHIPDHCACFADLCLIIGLLQAGPDRAMRFIDVLTSLIVKHHGQFYSLYKHGSKPKLHHAHHIPDGMRWLCKLLSCFVTERKHKSVKRAALYTFRHFEHTVTANVLSAQIETMRAGHNLFEERCLVAPRVIGHVHGAEQICTSNRAVTPVGELYKGDLVYTFSGIAGRIVSFLSTPSDLVIEIDAYDTIGGDTTLRSELACTRMFIDIAEIVSACVWYQPRSSVIRLHLPPIALF